MNSRTVLSIVAIALTARVQAEAAYTSFQSGTSCVSFLAETQTEVNVGGIHNIDPSADTAIDCPLPYRGSPASMSGVRVYFRDLNPSPGEEISCWIQGVNSDGTASVTSATTNSCLGMCPGYSDPGEDTFMDLPPLSLGSHKYSVECYLPPAYNGNFSRIVGYRATFSP